jgi:hypothetical protein
LSHQRVNGAIGRAMLDCDDELPSLMLASNRNMCPLIAGRPFGDSYKAVNGTATSADSERHLKSLSYPAWNILYLQLHAGLHACMQAGIYAHAHVRSRTFAE